MNPVSFATAAVSAADIRSSHAGAQGRIHQELLNRLNLERLGKVAREEAEPEIRA